MNERQRRFADEYIKDPNATKAAIKAGYSKKYANTNASKLLQNTTVANYIKSRLEELKKESIAEQDEILQFLTSVMRGEAKGKQKLGIGQGAEKVIDMGPSVQERVKAAEQLGKRYGMWTDKKEMELKVPTFLEDVPDDDDE